MTSPVTTLSTSSGDATTTGSSATTIIADVITTVLSKITSEVTGNVYSKEISNTFQTGTHSPTTVAKPASTPAAGPRYFSWEDYLVFAISLAIPVGIGLFFFIRSFGKQSTEEFLMGERSMNFVVVSLSILASLLSGVFVIGIPAEIHYYGIRIVYQFFGILIACCVVSHVFISRYQSMQFTSAYQYVQWRYNTATRIVASLIFILSIVIHLAVVLYVPALAFAQVTGLSIYITIVITGFICTVYTAIGGIKAVIWTDAIQMLILLTGLVAIAIVGARKLGGGDVVWQIAQQTGRTNFADFDPDPRHRTSFWSQCLGSAVVYIGLFISNQMIIQRYMAVPTSLKAQSTLYLTLALALPLFVLIAIVGLVLHATYAYCDPLARKTISSANQIVPLFMMDVLGDYYGIPGLLMSSIFAAALGAVSASINSLSAVVLEDFVDPAVLYFKGKRLHDRHRRWIAVASVIFFGALTIGLSFLASLFTAQLVQATNTIWGVLGGPLSGIFIMGFLLPFCNSWGAIAGMIGGLCISLWISVATIIYAPTAQTLAIGVCKGNITMVIPSPTVADPYHLVANWYNISYNWYGVIGTGSCLIIGIIVSLATGGYAESYRRSIKGALMFPIADKCCCCCPMACIICYRCGVDFLDDTPLRAEPGPSPDGAKVFIEPESLSDDSAADTGRYQGLKTQDSLVDLSKAHNGHSNNGYVKEFEAITPM